MRKFQAGLFLTFGLMCFIALPGAHALLLPKLNLGFVVPQGADPPILVNFLSFDTPVSISGADLLDYGVELHDLIPATNMPGYLVDITRLELTFTFDHPVSIAFGSGTWAPWVVTIVSGKPNYDLIFEGQGTIGAAGGSAPINENFNPHNGQTHAFGLLNASPVNDPDGIIQRDFRNAMVSITPIIASGAIVRGSPSVPEPGTLALGAMLLLSVSVPALRARRQSR